MFKEVFVSFKENFKEKVSNPFLGTYLLIWILTNWKLIFIIFNFDKETSLDSKLEIINNYFSSSPFIKGVLINIGLTFLVLIITYLLINISRGIVNVFEKQLKPIIYKRTAKSSIVLKEVYEKIRNERDSLLLSISKEREEKSKIEFEFKKIKEELLKVKGEKSRTESALFDERFTNSEAEKIYNNLIKDKKIQDFKRIVRDIVGGNKFNRNEVSIHPFLELGLIKYKNEDNYGARRYSLTENGDIIIRRIRLNNL